MSSSRPLTETLGGATGSGRALCWISEGATNSIHDISLGQWSLYTELDLAALLFLVYITRNSTTTSAVTSCCLTSRHSKGKLAKARFALPTSTMVCLSPPSWIETSCSLYCAYRLHWTRPSRQSRRVIPVQYVGRVPYFHLSKTDRHNSSAQYKVQHSGQQTIDRLTIRRLPRQEQLQRG